MSCPDCYSGHINPGTPTGRIETLHGYECYVADPPAGKKPEGIIVFFPDAFGFALVNNKIVADHYAAMGNYRVIFPDFMLGQPAPVWVLDTTARLTSTSTIWDWITKPYDIGCIAYAMIPFLYKNGISASEPRVRQFMLALRAEANKEKLPVGCAGFCWGGHHCVVLSRGPSAASPLNKAGERPLVDAAFTAHPSFCKFPQDFEGVTLPLSIAWGDRDMVASVPNQEKAREALKDTKSETEVKMYPGAGHGFGVRADHGNKDVEKQAKDAEEQAIAWFQKQFAQVKF